MPIKWPRPARCREGELVSDDDRTAGLQATRGHLPEGALMVAKIIEAPDGPGGVERCVVERQFFALGPGEPSGHLGMTLVAELELGAGDVHAVDGPVFG